MLRAIRVLMLFWFRDVLVLENQKGVNAVLVLDVLVFENQNGAVARLCTAIASFLSQLNIIEQH